MTHGNPKMKNDTPSSFPQAAVSIRVSIVVCFVSPFPLALTMLRSLSYDFSNTINSFHSHILTSQIAL